MNRLRNGLERYGLTQAELGRRTGFGDVQVHKLATGKLRLNEVNAPIVAEAIGCTIDELMRDTPPHLSAAVRICGALREEDRDYWIGLGERLIR